MPGKYPMGRCGTEEFCRMAGLSKTIFFTRYRQDPKYIKQFDIRIDALNRLNMSRDAGERFAETRAGRRAHGNAGRAMRRVCPSCSNAVHNRCNECRYCGHVFRWRCVECGKRTTSDAASCGACGAPRAEDTA